MSCLSVRVSVMVSPLSVRASLKPVIQPVITPDFKKLNISAQYINSTFKPTIKVDRKELSIVATLQRDFNPKCSLVCATSVVEGVRYVFVEPEYLWLQSTDLLSGDVIVTSNTIWEIN